MTYMSWLSILDKLLNITQFITLYINTIIYHLFKNRNCILSHLL